VTDSKKLSDDACRRLGPALMGRFEHAIERLDPPAYNVEHARQKNLNPMLADLHGRAIRQVAEAGDRVVVDRFANERLVAGRLAGLDVELIQTPRAESLEPAVAAASVIARHVFLEALAELSEAFALDLHKGAGAPTDHAARAFVALHGRERLGEVAKLHFKNTDKLGS
jgi:ribonuclease HIII